MNQGAAVALLGKGVALIAAVGTDANGYVLVRQVKAQCHVAKVDHAARGLSVWILVIAGQWWRVLASSLGFLMR